MLLSLVNFPYLLPQGVLSSLARNRAEHNRSSVNRGRQGWLHSLVVLHNDGNNWFSLGTQRVLLNMKGMSALLIALKNRNLFSAELSTFSIMFFLGRFVAWNHGPETLLSLLWLDLVLWDTCSNFLLCEENMNNNIDLSFKKYVRWSVIADRLSELILVLLGCHATWGEILLPTRQYSELSS